MTYPLPTLAAVVTATGISAPSYADIYQSLQASYQGIFGSDAYIAPDSQDGQLLAVVAKAISDANDAAIAVYNSYSPATAQGTGLSSMVRLNGIARGVPSNSTVDLTITGQVGATITNGQASDTAGNLWALPASVTIPIAGFIVATATCTQAGAIAAEVGAVNTIATPTLGWQSVTNASAATPGNPVETDAALRQRQVTSTALASQTVLDGIVAAVGNLTGVVELRGYENDTGSVNADGMPAHSISIVVDGGDAATIAETILLKKAPGSSTYGTTTEVVNDPIGIPYTINFFRPTDERILAAIAIIAATGYSTGIGDQLKQAVADYVNALSIGADVQIPKLYLPAQLYGGVGSESYELTSILISISPTAPGAADVPIAFNQRAALAVADITLTVT